MKRMSPLLFALFLLLCSLPGFAQSRFVKGVVSDTYGEPLVGVNVLVKGTANGTMTDFEGNYTIQVTGYEEVLVFSYIGYKTEEVAVSYRTTINVTLGDDAQLIDEVVVVGYGVQRKANLTGAVQSVGAKAIEGRPITNVNQALQGVAANVNIINTTGRANSSPAINIRGFTSINGGSALILVDNVPVSPDELSRINPDDIESVSILKDAASAAIYGGRASFGVVLVTTRQAKTNKLEISADATAGVRTFSTLPELIHDPLVHMTLANPSSTRRPLFYDAEFDYVRNMQANPDQYPAYRVVGLDGYLSGLYNTNGVWAWYQDIDYNDAFLRDVSPTYNANVRIANKTDKMSYAISSGYYHQDGMMRYGNDGLDRLNIRGNGSFKLTDWWEIGSNLSFNYQKYDQPEAGVEKYFWQISRNPMRAIYNPDGTYGYNGANLIGLVEEGGRKIENWNQTNILLNTTIDIIKNIWTVKADANFRFTDSNTKAEHYPVGWRPGPGMPIQYDVYGDVGNTDMSSFGNGTNYAYTRSMLNQYQVYNVYTDYNQTFGGKHAVHAMLGFNQEHTKNVSSWIMRADMISNSLPTINLSTGAIQTAETIEELALRGTFGRVNYAFDNKYLLELNGRYDGTSRFAKDSRFGFFPSGSLGWVVSQEKFVKPIAEAAKIDQFKLRASYGVLGNQVLSGYYPYIATMGTDYLALPVNGAMSLYVKTPGVVAADMTWETVRTVNFGLDLTMLNNRLNLSLDKYTRYTEGMLVQGKELPAVFGADIPKENAGDLKTQGWEITLGYNDKFNVGGSPLTVGVTVNLSDARTYVTKFDNPTKSINTGRGTANYYEGQEIGEIWGLVTDGFLHKDDLVLDADGIPTGKAKIDQTNVAEEDNSRTVYEGDLKFRDLNGDSQITNGDGTVNDPGDRIIIGNTSARLPYSFTVEAAYRGFDLRAFFYGVGKQDWYPVGNFHDFWGVFSNPWSSAIKGNLDNWSMNGHNAYFPRLKPYVAENTELAAPQTRYLQDASFLRFKNLTVGYTLPKALTQKMKLERLRVYLSAENLFTWDHLKVGGIDPELATAVQREQYNDTPNYTLGNSTYYPQQKVFTVGLNLNF
ncbi:MAG: TonB-dependent receptor [Tannerellaceae bacterium]|nr:TonB-dependent receptor [Tannerellaceae bacterium]